MTTIVGIQGNGWTVMAADSQITDENSKIISSATPKIINKSNILIGLRGDARPGDIVAYNWTPPRVSGDPQEWVVGKMIPSIMKAFDKNSYDYTDKDADFSFMVSVKGVLFDIGSDLSISCSDYDIYAVGSGKDIALGSAYSTYKNKEDIQHGIVVAIQAVEAACVYDIHTSKPIQTVWQET